MEVAADNPQRTPLTVLNDALRMTPVSTCAGCGVCCREVSLPPFLDEIDFLPAPLQREILAARKIEAELTRLRQPCIWWESATGRCRHHEHRPNICREYPVGEELCLEARARWG